MSRFLLAEQLWERFGGEAADKKPAEIKPRENAKKIKLREDAKRTVSQATEGGCRTADRVPGEHSSPAGG